MKQSKSDKYATGENFRKDIVLTDFLMVSFVQQQTVQT